jgi:Domain of unknown function (DUF4190)
MSGPPNLPPQPWGPPPPSAAPAPTPTPPPWSGGPAEQSAPLGYRRTEPFAIVSLVAALAGGFLCFIGPVAAIVFGYIARSRIKREGTSGSRLALWGVILGYVEIALGFIAIVLLIVVAVNSSGDATGSARRLGAEVQVVAEQTGSSPQNGDVIRLAIRNADIGDGLVFVGSTDEAADSATNNELGIAQWRLEVHRGINGKACLYIPASVSQTPLVTRGSCPGF